MTDLAADEPHDTFGDGRDHFTGAGIGIGDVFVDDDVAVAADVQRRRVGQHDLRRSRRRGLHPLLVDDVGADGERARDRARRRARRIEIDGAVGYWVKAGRRANAGWANREAARFFEQALRLIETLPETRETLKQAIDLRFDLKTSLIPLGQFECIISYLHEAENLAKRLDDQHRLTRYSFHMCQTLGLGGDPAEAFSFGRQELALADSLGDVPLQVAVTLFLGTASFSTRDPHQVEPLFVKALKLLDGEPHLERFGLAGFPAVTVRAFLARGAR